MTTAAMGAVATTKPRSVSRTPDRATVLIYTVAAVLAVLALLASQLERPRSVHPPRAVLIRRVYETRVVETVKGAAGRPSVTQSVSSSGASAAPVTAPATRTS